MLLVKLEGTETLEEITSARDGVRLLRREACDKDRLTDIAETVSMLDDAILAIKLAGWGK